MDTESVAATCRAKPGVTEGFPFGPDALVFKIGGKVFAIVHDASVSLKCEPGYAEVLRQQYPAVTAGYHLDKRHWNTVRLDGTVPDDILDEWIDDSFELVVSTLTRAQRTTLGAPRPPAAGAPDTCRT
jgi:predicted DNA-binding protein (MmcQ/YjbR family)